MQIVFSRKRFAALFSLALAKSFLGGTSEGSLLRGARQGDSRAFDRLRGLHEPALRRFVHRRVALRDVDDILQDTWLACWQSLGTFDGNGNFRTWLFSICNHKIQDHWRREHGRPPSADIGEVTGQDAYFPREFAGIEVRESLRELWDDASLDQRELLRMYYGDGLTLKEISQVLGRNLNTVKYQFYRFHELAAQKLPESVDAEVNRRVSP